jgi:microcystin-dependent protein
MSLPFYNWSKVAASNATADSTVNWAEGQSPSSVNDSARAMMASTAAYRDDIAGAIATGGTSTAYTVTSYQIFDSLSHLNGQMVAFTPHTTNGATVTLNVDGLGAKPLRSAPSVELPAGVLVQGTPYCALYNSSDAAFYLHGFFTNPYSIPVGASIDFWGSSAPNSSFVLAYGQAISRTTYSTLFAMFSTTYGSGDGSTTFNVPDLRGRVIAGKDDMGGSAASRIGSVVTDNGTITGATLGSVGGSSTHTLTTAEMPTHSHTVNDPGHVHTVRLGNSTSPGGIAANGSADNTGVNTQSATTGITLQNAGSSSAHAMLQPTIIANKLLRII